jgi:hypothetical protein
VSWRLCAQVREAAARALSRLGQTTGIGAGSILYTAPGEELVHLMGARPRDAPKCALALKGLSPGWLRSDAARSTVVNLCLLAVTPMGKDDVARSAEEMLCCLGPKAARVGGYGAVQSLLGGIHAGGAGAGAGARRAVRVLGAMGDAAAAEVGSLGWAAGGGVTLTRWN